MNYKYMCTFLDHVQAPGGGRQSLLQSSPARKLPNSQAVRSQASRVAQEAAQAALRISAEFPAALRLYVLFLEAADSHRLNSNLSR